MFLRATVGALALLGALSTPQSQEPPPAVRYVRIELPGEKRVLSLAEVQVVRNGRSLARSGAATQSSIDHEGAPARAVDGNWDGTYKLRTVTHTREETDPWWELDLVRAQVVDSITIWNRTDSNWDRLEGFRLLLLDDARNVVWSAEAQPAPMPRRDFCPWGAALVRPRPEVALREKHQLAIEDAIDRGVRWLKAAQQRDGSWGDSAERHGCGQTGLSLYALLKSGVPRTDPSVVRGFAHLRENPPLTTYSVSCALMAYGARADAADLDRTRTLLHMLLDWQDGPDSRGRLSGTWAYPDGTADLSNTQFAVLGLRAAAMAGLDVPRNAWIDALEGVLEYQEEPFEVELPARDGRSSTGERRIAGFTYHSHQEARKATGSMTAAGISSIAICEWGIGDKLSRKLKGQADTAQRLAMDWLEYYFAVGNNPGPRPTGGWRDYYLYGLERMGALLGLDLIGEHDWYWEGAWVFVGRQEDAGNWGGGSGTCFALLFLCRATAATSGTVARRKENVYVSEDEGLDVCWRVTGTNPVTMFVTGFGTDALDYFDDPDGIVRGLRVTRVEYVVEEEVIGVVEGDPEKGWTNERYAVQHHFDRGGTVRIDVRVHALDPHAATVEETTAVLEATGLDVDLGEELEDWMLEYPGHGSRNLLRRDTPRVSASSMKDDGRRAERAVDGLHSTAWVASTEDDAPTFTLDFERAVRADTILFSHVNRNEHDRNAHDRATRVEIRVNRRKEPHVVELSAEDRVKGVFRFPKPMGLRRLEIRIVDRVRGDRQPGFVGFAEIELLLEGR